MTPMTSPNDPIFFLHHCFIDKLWADWQKQQDKDWKESGYPGTAPRYNPVSGGPQGHNVPDVLKPWTHTIADVLDISTLSYSYEEAANAAHIAALAAASRRLLLRSGPDQPAPRFGLTDFAQRPSRELWHARGSADIRADPQGGPETACFR